ncbi:MAG: tyrosine-type recombinase/integrase [Ktedonobacteraceae bacterium]
MHDITIYQEPLKLVLPLPDGRTLTTEFPSAAQTDAAFLRSWLFGKSEKTQVAYLADIHKFYAHVGKSLQIVTLADVQAFITSLASLKAATQARAIAAIKSALSFGMKTGYLSFNVGAVVKLPKRENTLAERIMSERQVYRMIDAETNTRNHAILTLLYYGGLRAAEPCHLQWRHLQEREGEAGQVAIHGKGGKTRFVLLDTETWQEVMALKTSLDTPSEYVFRFRQDHSRTDKKGDNRRLDESMIHRIVRKAAGRVGIVGNVSPHWMRHANATHSIERGASLAMVQANLRHVDINTTARYTHVRPGASTATILRGKKP